MCDDCKFVDDISDKELDSMLGLIAVSGIELSFVKVKDNTTCPRCISIAGRLAQFKLISNQMKKEIQHA